MKATHVLTVAVGLTASMVYVATCPTALADSEVAEVPRDKCIVEVIAPEGTTVHVDGRDYETKRTLNFPQLRAGVVYESKVQFGFPDGSQQEHTILIQGGRRVQVRAVDPSKSRPELVPQTKPFWPMGLAISPDGRYVASGGNDGLASLWDAPTGRKLRTYPFHDLGLGVSPIGFTMRGDELFSFFKNQIVFWDIETGSRTRSMAGVPKGYVLQDQTSITADGRYLIAWGRESRRDEASKSYSSTSYIHPVLWDLQTGQVRQSWEARADGAVAGRKGERLVTWISDVSSSGDSTDQVTVWNLPRGQAIHEIKLESEPSAVAISPDERYLAVASSNAEVALYNAETGKEEKRLLRPEDGMWPKLCFSPDGQRLLVYAKTKKASGSAMTLWHAADGAKLWTTPIKLDGCTHVLFSPDGSRAAAQGSCTKGAANDIGSMEFVTVVMDVEKGAELCTVPSLGDIAFYADGSRIVADETVWDAATGRKICPLGLSESVFSLAFSSDGKTLQVENTVWSLATGELIRVLPGSGIRMSSDGRSAVSYEPEAERPVTCVRDVTTGSKLASFTGRPAGYSDNGRLVVTDSDDKYLTVWNVGTGRKFQTIPMGDMSFLCLAFSPDGARIVTAAKATSLGFVPIPPFTDCELVFWDVQTGRRIRTLAGAHDQNLVTFSATGSYLLSGGGTRAILWDAKTGRSVRTFTDEDGYAALSVAVSPDERQILVTYRKGKAIIWDVATGRRLRTFLDPSGWMVSGAFSPDGRRVVTGSTVARIWDIASGDELAQLAVVNTAGDWLVAQPDGCFDGSDAGRQIVSYRIGERLNVVPVDRFFQDFYRPGLFAQIWRGEGPTATRELGSSQSPVVKIVTPGKDDAVTSPRVTLEVEVTDQGGGVKGPWLVHNAARVLTPGTPEHRGKIVRRTFPVALVEGENRLEVQAASEDGSWESEPAVLVLRYQAALAPPQLHLVAIGVSRYAQETMNLKFAATDAQAMVDLFTERGPQLYGKEGVHATVLLDERATKTEITQALSEVRSKAQSQDTLVLFLAGHGTMLGQRYYFIPHDFKQQAEKLEDDIRQQGLPGDELDDALQAVPALRRVVIYDTCQSGGAMALSRTARDAFAFRGELERMSRTTGSFALAATAATARAHEVDQLRHGVLTYALLAGLGAVHEGPLADQALKTDKPVVEVRDWFAFAQDKVPLMTRLFLGEEQLVGFSSQGTSFPILPVEVKGTKRE